MTTPIRLAAVSAGYGDRLVLHKISLDVRPGEVLAIVGESGSGKSTLGKLITGQLEPADGTVLVEDRAWSSISRRDPARNRVQMIFQDSRDALNPWMTALKTVTEAVHVVDGLGRVAAATRARQLLDDVGLSGEVVDRRPGRLSGGQCQRVGIARALAHRPSVLVADEPTSALDVSVQAQVLALLRRLQSDQGMAIVMITHDLNVVRMIADRVHVLYRGRTMEVGATLDVLSSPAHPYARVLLDSRPGIAGLLPIVDEDLPPHPCVFASRCALRQPDCARLDYSVPTHVGRDEPAATHTAACLHPLPGGLELLNASGLSDQAVGTTGTDGPSEDVGHKSALREGNRK